ncbi:MAG: 4Fe-4S dicluster domain-containing protein [Oligoflexia bacterium]|nr:4Fe-4S dicluster domain-containing protein [Oligoflexia bacterium]MBF0366902.1 4Fe-4S dicluster domain-containing protein [Oligoflexia bacterium]
MRRGWVIDLEKCIGCRSCMVACKQHNAGPRGTWWNRVFTPGSSEHMIPSPQGKEYFLPVTCQHCKNAPCVRACPVDATYHQSDNSVLIDYDRCIGCRCCVTACPYGVRQFNWEDPEKIHAREEQSVPDYRYGYPREFYKDGRLVYMPVRYKGITEKCHFCVHYQEEGLDPACVRCCPGNARYVGDLDDPMSEVSRLIRDRDGFTLIPEKGTDPSCYYLPPKRKNSIEDGAEEGAENGANHE